jgi:hypothetical protein
MAARPSVPCSVHGPTLENRPSVLVEVPRAGICTAIVDHSSTHISARYMDGDGRSSYYAVGRELSPQSQRRCGMVGQRGSGRSCQA